MNLRVRTSEFMLFDRSQNNESFEDIEMTEKTLSKDTVTTSRSRKSKRQKDVEIEDIE